MEETWAPPHSAPWPPPDPPAAAPARDLVDTDRAVRRRHALVYGLVALGLAGVVGLVWGLGGFDKRTDLLQPTAPGTLISTGPYEFTFSEVTAQQQTDLDNSRYWELTAVGTGRTTGDVSIAPDYGSSGTFVSRDVRSREIEEPSRLLFGGRRRNVDGALFTPGLAPIRFEVQFKYAGSYVPEPTLAFAVFRLQFSDTSLIGGQDKEWARTPYGFVYQLPVRVLAPAPG